MNLIEIIKNVSPNVNDVKREVIYLRSKNPNYTNEQLAIVFTNSIRKKYTSAGVASALPSLIPGLGTISQIITEVTTISGDFALMLRYTAKMCIGVGIIYGRDMENYFDHNFILILGQWAGKIKILKDVSIKYASKHVTLQINKKISNKVIQAINKKVGVSLVAKYGSKRGGVAFGKLIPFGIGAGISATFNYATMTTFKDAAIKHYQCSIDQEYILID